MRFILVLLLVTLGELGAHQHGRHLGGRSMPTEECGNAVPSNAELGESEEAGDYVEWSDTAVFFPFLERFVCALVPKRYPCTFPEIDIQAYVHVIEPTEPEEEITPNITNITNLMSLTNDLFSETGFSFVLQGVSRTASDEWYNASAGSQDEYDLMDRLKVGGPAVLNVFIKNARAEDGRPVCGYARMAKNSAGTRDAVVINDLCIAPGDKRRNGDTLAHEIGHWLNLYHTFDGGCWIGDRVSDTPSQKKPTEQSEDAEGCPAPIPNSCPFRFGKDPIDNLMSYSPSNCRYRITRGQAMRMHDAWNTYRAPFLQ